MNDQQLAGIDRPAALAGAWIKAPYALFPNGDWMHMLYSSPLTRYRVLDAENVRIWGKGRHNYTGLLYRRRLAVADSSCRVTLRTYEVGGALVLYGGTLGRELALELRKEKESVSVHAWDATGTERLLTRSPYGPGALTLEIGRRGDLFECTVNGDLVWQGTLWFHLPAARPLLRAFGESRLVEGEERSSVFGPVELRGVQEERTIRGTVAGPDGRPVKAAWVHIAGDPFAHAQTDDEGRFELTFAPKGDDIVIAGAEGLDFAQGEDARDGMRIALPGPSIPRPEYPRPDFDRSQWWLNLNGVWRFAIDFGERGRAESWQLADEPYKYAARVPFPWTSLLATGEESLASDHRYAGVWAGYAGTAWYKRRVTIPADAPQGEIGVLKFLAVNAVAEVYWDGRLVGTHDGGFSHFECEVGRLEPGTVHELVVRAEYPREIDPIDTPVGKQGWWFTHAPGIWQTVWLESRSPAGRIERFHVRGDVAFRRELPFGNPLESASFHVSIGSAGEGKSVELTVRGPAGEIVHAAEHPLEREGDRGTLQLAIPVERPALWDIGTPNLYTFEARLRDGARELDRVGTYSGLREVRCDWAPGHAPSEAGDVRDQYKYVYLNDLPVYLIGILDQGYNPWGVYTYRAYGPADLEGSIRSDVEIALRMGYNLNRMHIKANEPLWLYEAARRGLMVWDEVPCFRGTPERPGWRRWFEQYQAQHERDYNCPAIIIRSIVNEAWGAQDIRTNPVTQERIRDMVALQRKLEPHRLVVDNSAAQGYPNRHVDTDINDEHIYIRDWWEWRRELVKAEAGLFPGSTYNFHGVAHGPEEAGDARQSGQPYVISEFSSHGRKASAMRMFPKIAGFVKIDLMDQEWERFTPITYTRAWKPLPFLDADLNPLGEEMEHTLDAIAIDAPPTGFYAPGATISVPVSVAAFDRNLYRTPITLHLRWTARSGDGPGAARVLKEDRVDVAAPPFTVKRLGMFEVEAPAGGGTVYLFAWLSRNGVVTARNYCEWKGDDAATGHGRS